MDRQAPRLQGWPEEVKVYKEDDDKEGGGEGEAVGKNEEERDLEKFVENEDSAMLQNSSDWRLKKRK